MPRHPCAVFFALAASFLGACAQYAVPGRAADMSTFVPDPRDAQTPGSIRRVLERQPLARFPTGIAVARVQDSGYRSFSVDSYGHGRYSVVTTRDIETDADFERLSRLPSVLGVAPVNRLLITRELRTDEDLRHAAASLHADLLLVYTFDTTFREDDAAPPLGLVTLGLFPTKGIKVQSTASAAILDTRNGYVYAVAEGTGSDDRIANGWSSEAAADDARQRAERAALDKLLVSLETAWRGVVGTYASPTAQAEEPQGARP